MARRHELFISDEQWERIEPFVPKRPYNGPWASNETRIPQLRPAAYDVFPADDIIVR
jgi:transposase